MSDKFIEELRGSAENAQKTVDILTSMICSGDNE